MSAKADGKKMKWVIHKTDNPMVSASHPLCRLPVTDQPGRLCALLLVTPALFIFGQMLQNDTPHAALIGRILTVFALVFFVYELFWIRHAEKKACML